MEKIGKDDINQTKRREKPLNEIVWCYHFGGEKKKIQETTEKGYEEEDSFPLFSDDQKEVNPLRSSWKGR